MRPGDVQAWLGDRAEEMAALVDALVRVPTENPPGRVLGRCAGLLSEAMERLGCAPELIRLAPAGTLEDPAIVRGQLGTGSGLVYFHGHFDVVPAQSPSQFEPRRAEGRITGRGTADMKGGLVSVLYGAAAARELGLLGDRRIVLHFVCDEETGSTAGSGHLRAEGLIDPSALATLTAEPTAVGRELDALLRYARSMEATAPAGRRGDAVDAGRCYFGGALTVLAHLGLVSDDEHRECGSG